MKIPFLDQLQIETLFVYKKLPLPITLTVKILHVKLRGKDKDAVNKITQDDTFNNILQEFQDPQVSQKLTRKRKRASETWKRNKQRQLRLAGKEHMSQAGNIMRVKSLKLVSFKCHYKCN